MNASGPRPDGKVIDRQREPGELALLQRPLIALVASTRVPPDLILPTLDLVRAAAAAEATFIGGFQSPLERECLAVLVRMGAATVVCPAGGIPRRRLPRSWRRRIDAGTLLILYPSGDPGHPRVTAARATARTWRVIELAAGLFTPAARPGSRTYAAAARAIERGIPTLCFEHRENRDLILLGARPVPAEVSGPAVARTLTCGCD